MRAPRWLALAALAALGAAALLAGTLPPGAAAAQALPAPIDDVRISPRAMQHILARHGPDSHAAGAGKFAPGTGEAAIRAMIGEAVRRGAAHQDTNGRPGTLYEYGFAQVIGVDIEGRPTRRLRVVVAPDGAVITAFPR